MHAIYKFDIAAKIPLEGDISFADVAKKCHLYEPDIRRILRFAMIYHRTFREPRQGFVAHTAASRQLATNSHVRDGIGLMFDDFWPSFARTVDALETFPDQKPNHSGWALAHESIDKNLFEYLATEPTRAARFDGAMKFFSASVPGNDPHLLLTAYPWASLGAATVVDVGGSTGYISAMLADAYPALHFVVQDLPFTIKQVIASKSLTHPDGRLIFQAQDFFEENQEKGADVYLFRWILHDWPDAHVVQILRALIPALKPGARVLVNDNVGPGQAGIMPHFTERFVREIDMIMLSAFNSYERERDDWERVFRETDARFSELKITNLPGSLLAVIEVVWNG